MARMLYLIFFIIPSLVLLAIRVLIINIITYPCNHFPLILASPLCVQWRNFGTIERYWITSTLNTCSYIFRLFNLFFIWLFVKDILRFKILFNIIWKLVTIDVFLAPLHVFILKWWSWGKILSSIFRFYFIIYYFRTSRIRLIWYCYLRPEIFKVLWTGFWCWQWLNLWITFTLCFIFTYLIGQSHLGIIEAWVHDYQALYFIFRNPYVFKAVNFTVKTYLIVNILLFLFLVVVKNCGYWGSLIQTSNLNIIGYGITSWWSKLVLLIEFGILSIFPWF